MLGKLHMLEITLLSCHSRRQILPCEEFQVLPRPINRGKLGDFLLSCFDTKICQPARWRCCAGPVLEPLSVCFQWTMRTHLRRRVSEPRVASLLVFKAAQMIQGREGRTIAPKHRRGRESLILTRPHVPGEGTGVSTPRPTPRSNRMAVERMHWLCLPELSFPQQLISQDRLWWRGQESWVSRFPAVRVRKCLTLCAYRTAEGASEEPGGQLVWLTFPVEVLPLVHVEIGQFPGSSLTAPPEG